MGKDAAQGKLTFPGVLGVEESLRHAQQQIDEACRSLGRFGDRAEGLESLAKYVLQRNR